MFVSLTKTNINLKTALLQGPLILKWKLGTIDPSIQLKPRNVKYIKEAKNNQEYFSLTTVNDILISGNGKELQLRYQQK